MDRDTNKARRGDVKRCEIHKAKYSWHVVVLSEKMGQFIVAGIKNNHLPYVNEIRYCGRFGCLVWGGLNIEIVISAMAEEDDLAELESLIEAFAEDHVIKTTRHRKKLTSFLPRHVWSANSHG